MYKMFAWTGVVLALVSLVAVAQEPAAVADARPAEGAPENELSLRYDPAGGERSIQEEISIDLIDLEALRRAIEENVYKENLRLTLDECIQIALANNPDIVIAGFEPMKSAADVFAARGEFDPGWQTSANYRRTSASVGQDFAAFGGITSVESYTTTINSAVGGKLHYGTQYAVAYNLSKEENTYGGFIEEFSGQLSFTLTQPLLRGFGKKLNTVRIRGAEKAKMMSAEQLRLTVLTTASEVVKAYWDLVGAVENVKVQEGSLANAERLLRISQTRREIGTAADIEVLQAKAGVATRQSELVNARSLTADASDRLKRLLDLRDEGRFSRALVVPVDRPNLKDVTVFDWENMDTSLQASVDRALENRPDLAVADLQIESAELDEMRARNEMLPQFDITGTYGQGGRNHKLRESLYGVESGDDVFYSYGFEAMVPFGNRAARGAYQRAKLSRRQAEVQRDKTEQDLIMMVHMAARNVVTNKILVESNQQARRLQEANVVAEEKRLKLGVTTSWQVLQVQEDLTLAQTVEVRAQTAYEKALVDLQLAEGTLLDSLNVALDVPEGEDPPGYFSSIRPRWE